MRLGTITACGRLDTVERTRELRTASADVPPASAPEPIDIAAGDRAFLKLHADGIVRPAAVTSHLAGPLAAGSWRRPATLDLHPVDVVCSIEQEVRGSSAVPLDTASMATFTALCRHGRPRAAPAGLIKVHGVNDAENSKDDR